jgi:putative glutamine amidotransferase
MAKLIGIASDNFTEDFRAFIPGLRVFSPGDNINDYKLMIFSGGADITPTIYNEQNTASYPDPARDAIETTVLDLALEAGIKILGVCRGHQLINAVLGGKLTQNLYHPGTHTIAWINEPDIKLQEFFPLHVNSLHHQGYFHDQIAPSLKAVALEPKTGLVEASTGENIVTVQFHPEWMYNTENFFNWLINEF